MAHAIKNEDVFGNLRDPTVERTPATVLLFLLATDSVRLSSANQYDDPTLVTYGAAGGMPVVDQFKYYCDLDFSLLLEMEDFISGRLSPYSDYFEHSVLGPVWCAINEKGRATLQREWPKLHSEIVE